jgi:hypothetical protein
MCVSSIPLPSASPSCHEQITDKLYYELEKRSYCVNKEHESELNRLSDTLIRDWTSELEQTECKGSILQPIKIIDSSRVTLEIRSHSLDRLNLHAQIDFRKQNKKVI